MGVEIDQPTCLKRLRSDIGRIRTMAVQRPGPTDVWRHLLSAVRTFESDTSYARACLGLGVMGYIFIDPETRDLVPLFSSSAVPAALELPWYWRNEAAAVNTPLVNEMFVAWRRSESLEFPLTTSLFPPEYLYYLPVASQEDCSFVHPDEQRFRSRHSCHYVPLGEVLFFMMAWRVLLCFGISKSASLKDFISHLDQHCTGGGSHARETQCLWSDAYPPPLAVREFTWNTYAHHLHSDVRLLWDAAVRRFDTGPSPEQILLRGISACGGLPRRDCLEGFARTACGVSAVQEYMKHIADVLGCTLDDIWDRTRLFGRTDLTVASYERDTRLLLRVLSRLVAQMVLRTDDADVVPSDAPRILRELQQYVRFPLLPYYYWAVLDGWPRTHLVCPVLQPFHQRISICKPRTASASHHIPSYHIAYREAANATTPVVGVCVLGVDPIVEVDWTVRDQDAADSVAPERLGRIRDYISVLAEPVIDNAFYAMILQERQRHRLSEFSKYVRGMLSHDIARDLDSQTRRMHALVEGLKAITGENKCSAAGTSTGELCIDRTRFRACLSKAEDLTNNTDDIAVRARQVMFMLSDTMAYDQPVSVDNAAQYISRALSYLGLSLDVTVEPQCQIVFNEHCLRCMLRELVWNSFNHNRALAERRELQISITARAVTAAEGLRLGGIAMCGSLPAALCAVSDNGKGVEPDLKEAVFHRASSGSAGERSSGEAAGSGMGLAWIRRAVRGCGTDQHRRNGFVPDIWEAGEYGSGATFQFLLPLPEGILR